MGPLAGTRFSPRLFKAVHCLTYNNRQLPRLFFSFRHHCHATGRYIRNICCIVDVASRLSHYLAQHDLNIRQPTTMKHRRAPSPCSELQTPRRKGPCLLCLPHILHLYYKDGPKDAAVDSDTWVRQAPTLQLPLSRAQGPGVEI